MDAYDVIIIGTGAGGGTLARHLAPSGKRILLLERGDWLTREPQNWSDQARVRGQPLRLAGDVVRRGRQPLPARCPLLRRWSDEALRRRPVPAAQGGLRRATASRRHLARLADRLRRAGALLHARGAALPGARRAWRGPDRASGERALPASRRIARAADPAARRRPRGSRLPAVPRAVRDHARRVEPAVLDLHPLCDLRRLPLPRAREVRRRGARRSTGPRASERDAADEREGRQARDERGRAPPSPRWSSSATGPRSGSRATSSSSHAARPTRPGCCCSRRATGTRTVSPTARTRSAATTCSTTRRPSLLSRARRTRPRIRRRSG